VEAQGSPVRAREAAHHDRLASALDPASMPPREPDRLEQMLFASIGDVTGLRVLELGCGDGDITLQLLDRGASVVAIDISPRTVEVARARVERFLPHASAAVTVAAVEDTRLEEGSFDLVVGKWILHHVDVDAAATEIRRVLRPGGRGVFFENQGVNPVLSLARRYLVGRFGIPRFGTKDEHPLSRADYALWRSVFANLELDYPDFHFFELFSRQIFHGSTRLRLLTRRLDLFLWRRLPRLRRYSFHVIVKVTR
jgi:ubiquinone/menaquinone biosynthesis C-methylase UbiE